MGTTVAYSATSSPAPTVRPAMGSTAFLAEVERGGVDTLLVLGGNPAYDAAPSQRFLERSARRRAAST